MRACIELLTKYFDKRDKNTYLYRDVPLWIPNEPLKNAAKRIKTMRSSNRKQSKKNSIGNQVGITTFSGSEHYPEHQESQE
jgi:hypothetical protein